MVRRRPTSATSGPRPAATASTTSSAPRCSAPTTPTSTSRSSPCSTASSAPSGSGSTRCCSTRSATPACRPALHRGAAGVPRAHVPTTCREQSTRHARSRTRCACSTRSGARRGRASRRAAHRSTTCATSAAAHFDRVQAGLRRARDRRSRSTPRLVRGPRLLHPHDVRVRSRRARRGAERDRRRRSLRRAGRAAGRPADARHRLRRRASSASLLACDAEGVFPAPESDRRRVRGRHDRRRRRRSRAHATSCASPASRADRAFDGRSMKAQMKAADRSGAALALIVGERRAAPRRRSPSATCADRRAGESGQRRSPSEVIDYVEEGSTVTRARRCAPTMCGELRASRRRARPCRVCGWVARRREHGEHLAFIDVRDHTGIVQCVVDGAHDLRSEYVVRITGTVRGCGPRAPSTPNLADRRGRDRRLHRRGAVGGRAAAVPDRRPGRQVDEIVRLRYRYLDLRRERMQRNLRIRATVNSAIRARDGAAGLRRGRDADADAVDARGRARVPRAVAPAARLVLRAAAEPAAVQAAADGRRHRPLLPDRPLPARRRPARRPPVRVHAARRRDELRRPGRRARVHQRGGARRGRGGHSASGRP